MSRENLNFVQKTEIGIYITFQLLVLSQNNEETVTEHTQVAEK